MSVFPETSVTLLQKLAAQTSGTSEAAWVRFFDLYIPAIRRFAEWHGPGTDPDDVVQDVCLKLLDILREGEYDPRRGSFRAYLATLIRRHLVDLYRREQARGGGGRVSLDDVELVVPAEQVAQIDLKWRLVRHEAAVEHVLTRTALSAQSKAVYRAHVLEGRPADEVARAFGITKNLVGQIKFRIDRTISAMEAELGGEDS